VSAHAEFLRAASNNKELASQLKVDFRKANLPQRDFRMLEFVEKLTLSPWLIVETDIKRLREAGFSDAEILHIVMGSAHFNYLNRMADGIGIRFEYQTDIAEFKVPSQSSESEADTVARSERPSNTGVNSTVAWIRFPDVEHPSRQESEPLHLFQVMGENPPARDLAREWRAYQLAGTSALDARTRAQLALLISALNRCDYSVYWFGKVLRGLGTGDVESKRLASGELPDQLTARDALVFRHAERLTREPWVTRETHIQELRQAGLDDHGILQLTMLCSYVSFESRVALGLGLALDGKAPAVGLR
jgi:AhpD family alkylhydroperoxidase